jgi:hypothetical protein
VCAGNVENEQRNEIKQTSLCFARLPIHWWGLQVHRRSSLAGTVLRSINCVIASAGMRTARPQFTRGSFLRDSQALIVAGLSASISLASLIESNLFISLASERNRVLFFVNARDGINVETE